MSNSFFFTVLVCLAGLCWVCLRRFLPGEKDAVSWWPLSLLFHWKKITHESDIQVLHFRCFYPDLRLQRLTNFRTKLFFGNFIWKLLEIREARHKRIIIQRESSLTRLPHLKLMRLGSSYLLFKMYSVGYVRSSFPKLIYVGSFETPVTQININKVCF